VIRVTVKESRRNVPAVAYSEAGITSRFPRHPRPLIPLNTPIQPYSNSLIMAGAVQPNVETMVRRPFLGLLGRGRSRSS
jgi:hypothetical protein